MPQRRTYFVPKNPKSISQKHFAKTFYKTKFADPLRIPWRYFASFFSLDVSHRAAVRGNGNWGLGLLQSV
jgi:hypothetical protein